MATWKEISSNPDYQKLPDAEKKKVIDVFLEKNDDFRGLPEGEQQKARAKLYSTIGEPDDISAESIVSSTAKKAARGERFEDAKNDYGTSTPGLYRFLKTFEAPTYASLGLLLGPAGIPAAMGVADTFNPLDRLYDKIRQRETRQYEGMTAEQAMLADQKRSGLGSDLLDAASNSTIGRMLYSFHRPEAQKKIESVAPEGYQYQPKHEMIHGVANALVDAPLYMGGSMVGGPMGAFALPATLRKLYEAKISGKLYNPSFSDILSGKAREMTEHDRQNLKGVLQDIGREYFASSMEGLAFHGVGKLAGTVAERMGMFKALQKVPEKVLTATTRAPMAAAALTGANELSQAVGLRESTPLTMEGFGKTVGQIAIMEAMGIPGRGWRAPVKDRLAVVAEAKKISAKTGKPLKEVLTEMRSPENQAVDPRANLEKVAAEIKQAKETGTLPEYLKERVRPIGEFEMPKEAIRDKGIDMEPIIQTVYPEGWNRKTKQVRIAYQGRPKVREQIEKIANTWWDRIKTEADKNPPLMQELVKDKTLKNTFFDKRDLDPAAQAVWEKPGYRKTIEKEMDRLVGKYSDAETIQQMGQWRESEKPYQIKSEQTTEMNRQAFEQAQYVPPTEPWQSHTNRKLAEQMKVKAVEAKREAAREDAQAGRPVDMREIEAGEGRANLLVKSWGGSEGSFTVKADPVHIEPLFDLMQKTTRDFQSVIGSIPEAKPQKYQPELARRPAFERLSHEIGIKNVSREIERKYGEKTYKAVVEPVRQAEHNYVVDKAEFKKQYDNYVKGVEKEFGKFRHTEWENVGRYLTGRQEEGAAILAAMKEKPLALEQLTPKEQKIVHYFDEQLPKLLDRINAAREIAGLSPIEGVKDYFTFLRKFSMAEELGINPIFAQNESWKNAQVSDIHPKGFTFQFGNERISSLRPIELNASNVFERYMNASLRTIHMTPVIGRIRDMLENHGLMERNPGAYQYLTETLDYVGGKRQQYNPIMQRIANRLTKNLGMFYLAGNLNTIFVQPSSYVMTFTALGPKYGFSGLKDLMSSDMRKLAYNKSAVLQGRIHDITVEEMKKTLSGKFGKVQSAFAEKAMLPMKYIDLAMAESTWLAGFRYAKDEMGLQGKDAYQYADKLVIQTQGSGSRIDLAPIQRSPLGKMFTLFNTFTINQWNFIMDDVLGKSNLSQSSRSMQLARLISGMAIANTLYEIAGYAIPWGITNSPFPAPLSEMYKAMAGQEWTQTLGGEPADPNKQYGPAGVLTEGAKEMMGILPVVGGSFKYGGESVYGAGGQLMIDTLTGFAELNSQGPGKLLQQIPKWAGAPGGSQVAKIIRHAIKNDKSSNMNNLKPLGGMKPLKGL